MCRRRMIGSAPAKRPASNAMRFPKRRADWRLGRWTAKRALSAYLNVSWRSSISRRHRDTPSGFRRARGLPCRPAGGRHHFTQPPQMVRPCARSRRPVHALGCDLELIEPRSDAFVADYFTAEEQALIAQSFRGGPVSAPGATLEREGERAQGAARRASAGHTIRNSHSARKRGNLDGRGDGFSSTILA